MVKIMIRKDDENFGQKNCKEDFDLKAVRDDIAHDNRSLCVCVQSRVSIITFIFSVIVVSMNWSMILIVDQIIITMIVTFDCE